uniref:Uncharacterized protein n=1 Tax=Anthurium amnicola TaxID=1678845 RepID=A0A1D1YSS9_9ARAE
MASALVNNVGLVPPDGFLDLQPYGWISPRVSFGRDFSDDDKPPQVPTAAAPSPEDPAAEDADLGSTDFEFRRLDDPVAMLPADELFSDGKLVPLQMASPRPPPESAAVGGLPHELGRAAGVSGSEGCLAELSPKAPRCSSRWRELLGLKRAAQADGGAKLDSTQRSWPPLSPSPSPAGSPGSSRKSPPARSLRHLLHRSRKSSSMDSSLSLPLLRDSDSESVSVSVCAARLSLSSSSCPDHEDVPRLSLDSDRAPSQIPVLALGRNPPRVVRLFPPRSGSGADPSSQPHPHHRCTPPSPGASAVDSPRMNSSGKVVFHGLERSSSSPSAFSSVGRAKRRGMERSYSANVVRVTPVLNVPVCSLWGASKAGSVFGLGHQLFSPSSQKKDSASWSPWSGATRNGGGGGRRPHVREF